METLKTDVLYALSRFRRETLATFVIVLTLALGIGSTSAIFSVVNGVLLNAAPFNDADRLVALRQFQPAQENSNMGLSAQEIADYRTQTTTMEEVAEYHNMTFTMYGHGDPKRVRTGVVSANFFPMLGVTPILGRTFNPEEDQLGAAPLILLTYEYWRQEFSANPNVVGEQVEMNNRAHEIIGVLPAFPQFPNVNDVYMAIPSCPWRSGTVALENRSQRFLSGFGKVKPEISLSQAKAETSTIASRLSSSFPEDYPANGDFDSTALSLVDELVRGSRSYLLVLLGTTILVLLISSANVTNLILSQHARRQREFAVRSAIGASRSMLAKQLLTEAVLLSLFAGVLGLVFAFLGIEILQGLAEHFTSRANQIVIDGRVVAFTLFISIATGVLAGILPSLAKQKLVTALKEGGKSSYSTRGGPLRNLLLILQFGLSLTLLVAAGMALKSLNGIQQIETGFKVGKVQVAQLDLNWTTYGTGPSQWQFTQDVMGEVEELPYVDRVSAAFTYPLDSVMGGFGQIRQAPQFDNRAFNPNDVLSDTYIRSISTGYFETLGIPLIQGRDFSDHDTVDDPRVVIVNQSFANLHWPGQSALERKISFDQGQNWYTIVGIAGNVKETDLTTETQHQIYRPMSQFPAMHIALLANSQASDTQFRQDFRDIIERLDPQQAISKYETMEAALENSLSLQTFIAQVLSIFAAIAMFITVSGISGVLSYMVSVRTREIGIRMAIGADQKSVLLLILLYALRLSLAGLVLGLFGAWWVAGLLHDQLYNVTRQDISVYLVCLTAMLLITIAASLLPSYRASRMEPNQALRAV